MGSIPPEASLDFVPKSISNFLREISTIANISEKVSKVDDFAKGLEQEMKKIDGFKRELPLTMLLLNDAISSLKGKPIQCLAPETKPVFEEFMPLKKEHTENNMVDKTEKDYKEKKNWMSSVQLWNSNDNPITPDPKCISKTEEKVRNQGGSGKDVFEKISGARAFMPFKSYEAGRKERLEMAATPRNGPQARKQRRCWSPELHRRFINALHQLGGSQVATPKQIRELMQVDGLTNDEVKSHLQKYRLHTRRNQSVVGLWMNKHDESLLKASSGSNSTIDEDENSEAYI